MIAYVITSNPEHAIKLAIELRQAWLAKQV